MQEEFNREMHSSLRGPRERCEIAASIDELHRVLPFAVDPAHGSMPRTEQTTS